MKYSLKWLQQYVDLTGISDEQLSATLSSAGLEVDGISRLATGSNLVIGHVLTCEKHPNSDHLHVTHVDLGPKYGISQIVCGAPNIAKGQNVIVARPGAILANNLKIQVSQVRDVTSAGMICSLGELGVDSKYLTPDQVAGIEVLSPAAPIGDEDVLAYLELDDKVLDINLLANRSDALSLYNLALELGGLFNRDVAPLKLDTITEVKPTLTVESKTAACPTFALQAFHGVSVNESPLFMKRRLMAAGIRSVNNIVDIGNYIMLLTGQPLHMYDLDKVAGRHFVIDDRITKDDFIALDEQKYAIMPGDITISVNDKIACLGGVMGSADSGVDQTTKNLAVEAATFNGPTIRRTAVRLNLISDASQRFAKGINPHQTATVLKLTAGLLKAYAGVDVVEEVVITDTANHQQTVVASSVTYINHRLGSTFTKEEIKDTLARVHVELKFEDDDHFLAYVPAHRIDITEGADLSEEVIRLLGFDRLSGRLNGSAVGGGGYTQRQLLERKLRSFLRDRGLYESITYTLISEKETKQFNYLLDGQPLNLLHPLTPDHSYVRVNILGSLINAATYNHARQNADFGLFEISEVQTAEQQQTQLAIVLVGDVLTQGQIAPVPVSYYHVKGYLESILDLLGIEERRTNIESLNSELLEFHPGRSATLTVDKQKVAVFGELHPSYLAASNYAKTNVVALTVNLSALFNIKVSPIKAKPIAKYPSITRDIAVTVKRDTPVSELIRVIKKAGKVQLVNVEVFDVYKGEHVASDEKSVALTLTYQAQDKTLTEQDITSLEQVIITAITSTFAAKLRS